MGDKVCKVLIDGKAFEFDVTGDFFWGENEVLFQKDDNVLAKVDWLEDGYSVVKAFSAEVFNKLQESVKENVCRAIQLAGIEFDKSQFELEDYHKVVTSDEKHQKVINVTRDLRVSDFDFDIDALTTKFGEILGCQLTSYIEELQRSHIQLRLSRPKSLDINPPHRDGYLSYWEDIINIWIPIAGCNEKSSLPVVPKSHMLPENQILRTNSKGATINGNVYYVPCILETNEGSFNMVRPNPREGEALLFSPYLIHGSAVNQNNDITRVALELRFPKVG